MTQIWCRSMIIGKDLCTFSKLAIQKTIPSLQYKQIRMVTSQERDPHKRNFPEESKPDYDLVGSGPITQGELVVPPPEETYPDVEVVKDPELWKFVERLLPRTTIPEVPEHKSYPTPSGWRPPKEESLSLPYQVQRNKYQHFPLYLEIFDGGSRKMTCICKVHGNMWALESEIRQHLEEKYQKPMFTQVDEVCGKLRVRGNFMEDVSDFLLSKGM